MRLCSVFEKEKRMTCNDDEKKGTKESGDGDDDDGDVEKVIAWIMSKSVIDTFRRARAAAATETKSGRGQASRPHQNHSSSAEKR